MKLLKLGKIRTSKTEMIDIAKGWGAISLAFTIAWNGLNFTSSFLLLFVISALTVGIGFLLHELAHKFVAQKYGCIAEFRSFDHMLVLAVALSFLGFIFAAPGAVFIQGMITRKENGIISAAGPLTNFVLALIFLGANTLVPQLSLLWMTGFQINLWLGLFNMIPVWNFDGKKIWQWNPAIWVAMVIFAVYFIWFF